MTGKVIPFFLFLELENLKLNGKHRPILDSKRFKMA